MDIDESNSKFKLSIKNIDYRKGIIASEITSALGLIGLVFLPELFSDPLPGILVCVCMGESRFNGQIDQSL